MNAGQLLRGVPHHIYHADLVGDLEDAAYGPPRLSRSIACKLLMETPLRAKEAHPKLGGKGQPLVTKAADMGTIVHSLMTGDGPPVEVCMIPAKGPDGKFRPRPEQDLVDALAESVIQAKDGKTFSLMASGDMFPAANWLTKDAQKFQAEARSRGAIAVLAHDLVQAKAAAAALPEKLAALGIDLAAFEPEMTILWEEDGVALKTRPDLTSLSLGAFLDFKITDEISEAAFDAAIHKRGLDMQVVAALEGMAAVHPELAGRLDYEFVVCEWKEPFDVMVKPLSQAWLSLGLSRWRRAKDLWKECLESGNWPGWGRRPPAEPKPWLLTQELVAQGDPDWAEGAGS